MKLKLRLSLIVIVIMAVVVAGISIVLLTRASSMQMAIARESQARLASYHGRRIQGRYDGYMRVAISLANEFSEFETLPVEDRRRLLADNMDAILKHEKDIMGIFAVFKPNVLDGLDAQYAGKTGSSPTGQFIPWYHQMNGPVEFSYFADYEGVTFGDRETAGNPYVQKIQGKDTMLVRLTTPVFHPVTKEVIGRVGIDCNLNALQGVVDQAIKDEEDIAYLAVYSGDGTVLASYVPERVGKKVREADSALFSNHMNEVIDAIGKGKQITVSEYAPVLHTNLEIVIRPFTISNADTPWAMGMGTPRNVILTEVKDLEIFTIVVALAAIVITAFIIYFVAGSTTKPIVNVALTLK
jgi:methyl-accepting chemotaxis protein